MRRLLFVFGALLFAGMLMFLGSFYFSLRKGLSKVFPEADVASTWKLDTTKLSLPLRSLIDEDSLSGFSPDLFSVDETPTGPWLTWYWPIGQIDRNELIHQLVWIKDRGFGGVEIYPIPSTLEERPFSLPLWAYLEDVLIAADRINLKVDLLAGASGMALPSNAPDSLKIKQLLYGESHVLGGKEVRIPLPTPKTPAYYYLNAWEARNSEAPSPFIQGGLEGCRLVSVYGIKAVKELRTKYFWDLYDQTYLDPDSVFVLNKLISEGGELVWNAPGGYWKVVAIYAAPNGQRSYLPLHEVQGSLSDPFDSLTVRQHLAYTTQSLGKLSEEALKGLHGLTYGPATYQADEFYLNGIEENFVEKAGFELKEWLPGLLFQGKNNALFPYYQIGSKPEYVFTEEDDKVRESYRLHANREFLQAGISFPREWYQKRGLHTATEPYGWDFDVIEAAALSDIPVFDQNHSASSSLLQKLVSSGAILGGRPIVRARTLGYKSPVSELTPQEIRLAVDRCLMNGANEILVDGANFYSTEGGEAYQPDNYSRPHPVSEQPGDQKFWKELNAYLARMQALARMGKAGVEIAIYYPFAGIPTSMSFLQDHDEPFFNGRVGEVRNSQPILPSKNFLSGFFKKKEDPRVQWLKAITPLVRELDQQGLNWIWVNDSYLASAQWDGKKLTMGSTQVSLVLLPEVREMDLAAAENLAKLAREGAKVIAYGKIPERQRGFLDHEEGDPRVAKAMESILYCSPILDPEELRNLIEGIYIPQTIDFDDVYPFLRRTKRLLVDSSEINIFQNISSRERVFQLDVKGRELWHYWLDPHAGEIHPAEIRGSNNLQGYISGFGMRVLLSSPTPLADSLLSPLPSIRSNPFEYKYLGKIHLERWDLAIEKNKKTQRFIDYRDTLLMDWNCLTELEQLPEEAYYSTKFEVPSLDSEKQFLLELGHINTIADVSINTHPIKTLFYHPYTVDISPYVEEGLNIVEIWVKKPHFLDEKIYRNKPLKRRPPVGMLGPALIHVIQK